MRKQDNSRYIAGKSGHLEFLSLRGKGWTANDHLPGHGYNLLCDQGLAASKQDIVWRHPSSLKIEDGSLSAILGSKGGRILQSSFFDPEDERNCYLHYSIPIVWKCSRSHLRAGGASEWVGPESQSALVQRKRLHAAFSHNTHIYIYIYIYICICMHVCVYIYIYIYI